MTSWQVYLNKAGPVISYQITIDKLLRLRKFEKNKIVNKFWKKRNLNNNFHWFLIYTVKYGGLFVFFFYSMQKGTSLGILARGCLDKTKESQCGVEVDGLVSFDCCDADLCNGSSGLKLTIPAILAVSLISSVINIFYLNWGQ